jgi:pyrroloquinoline quinone biosynthesis protein A
MAVAKTARHAGPTVVSVPLQGGRRVPQPSQETCMTWTTPAAQDLRFGFEITMYISAR